MQAALLSVLEEHLYAGEHEDGAAAEMYPGYLVLLTSAAGATLTHRLATGGRLSRAAAWALHCVFAAKLTMLLVPEVRLTAPRQDRACVFSEFAVRAIEAACVTVAGNCSRGPEQRTRVLHQGQTLNAAQQCYGWVRVQT